MKKPRAFAIVQITAKNARKLREGIADPKTDPQQRRLMEALLRMYEERYGRGE